MYYGVFFHDIWIPISHHKINGDSLVLQIHFVPAVGSRIVAWDFILHTLF